MSHTQWSRIVTVLTSPTTTFRSIAERPTWHLAFLVPVVLSLLSALIVFPKLDWEQTAHAKYTRLGREVPEERIARVVEIFSGPEMTSVMVVLTAVVPGLACALAAWILARLFRRMGAELSFETSLGVFAHGVLPLSVATVLALPFIVGLDRIVGYQESGWSNLGFLASPSTSLELFTVLSHLDLFAVWSIVLLVIGYSVAAGVSKARAAFCVVGLWIVWIVFQISLIGLDRIDS
ncbi:MAG: YIP1 family protein [Actinomycetia bacterium]|nr:YIP1 family protein [Actinomycetes bacterium]